MPVLKIDLPALRAHFRRRWAAYLALAAALCLFNHVLFSVTRPRIPAENTLRICLVGENTHAAAADGLAGALLERVRIQIPQLEKIEFSDFWYPESTNSRDLLLQSHIVSGSADLFICDEHALARLISLGACFVPEDLCPGAQAVFARDAQTGESVCAAVTGDLLDPLIKCGAIHAENICLTVAKNGGKPALSADAARILLAELTKGTLP